jgi:hypothetical protein
MYTDGNEGAAELTTIDPSTSVAMHPCQLILLVLSFNYRPYILAIYFILKIGINRGS